MDLVTVHHPFSVSALSCHHGVDFVGELLLLVVELVVVVMVVVVVGGSWLLVVETIARAEKALLVHRSLYWYMVDFAI